MHSATQLRKLIGNMAKEGLDNATMSRVLGIPATSVRAYKAHNTMSAQRATSKRR